MSKSNQWMLKALAVGAGAALITFVLFYGFLTIHTEFGLPRTSAYKLAILAFLAGTIAAAIYFRVRTDR
jgi:hypothetical protein